MGFYRQPQSVWIRRAMFQIHLWTGIGMGLYIVVVCLTGSVLVFRRELMRTYSNRPQIRARTDVKPLTEDELRAAALHAFPDFTVEQGRPGGRANTPFNIWMNPGREKKQMSSGVLARRPGQTFSTVKSGNACSAAARSSSSVSGLTSVRARICGRFEYVRMSSRRNTRTLPVRQTTTMYRPMPIPVQRWIWNIALRIHTF